MLVMLMFMELTWLVMFVSEFEIDISTTFSWVVMFDSVFVIEVEMPLS